MVKNHVPQVGNQFFDLALSLSKDFANKCKINPTDDCCFVCMSFCCKRMKLCSHRTWKYIAKTEAEIFVMCYSKFHLKIQLTCH